MFIGHAALGLAAKPLAPRAPLVALLVATYWLDIVWPVLLLVGVERVRIDPRSRLQASPARRSSPRGRGGSTGTAAIPRIFRFQS